MSVLSDFRKRKDEFFRLDHQSPLTPEQRASFEGLRYFEENSAFDLEVELEPFEDQEEIQILTNTGEVQTYARYGRFQFYAAGEPAELTIFQNEHGFFLPFSDALARVETYGAGRYLEPEPLPGGRFRIDFNMAYNPYCAYNPHWSCPITPAENRLKVPIPAGEKMFADHE
jgi:uncharacterized protein (DUF1684 family)